jgi:hypothetical protein
MKRQGLPPLVGAIKNGEITWKRIETVDHETLGYMLACHLIVEHYLTEALKSATWPVDDLQWDAARLTFSQKISILPSIKGGKFQGLIPCVKHLNSLRNKFSHNIEFRLDDSDLAPFVQLLTEISRGPQEVPKAPIEVLEIFTTVVCAYFGGMISTQADIFKRSRK